MVTDSSSRRHVWRMPGPLRGGLLGVLIRRRGLIWAFAQRDFRTRYRTSLLGWSWSLIQPLASLAVFAVVFSVVFRAQAPPLGDGGRSSYAVYLFTGFIAWNLFAELLKLSMSSLRESGPLLRKVAFPGWAPVLGSALVQMIQVALEMLVLLTWFAAIGNIGWAWLYAPFVLLGLALFAQGVGLLLSTTNARYGDVEYMVVVSLGALYFLTPVLYPLSAIPASTGVLRFIVEWQPVSWYVRALHSALYLLDGPGVVTTAGLVVFGAAIFLGGLWVFDRTTEDIGELL